MQPKTETKLLAHVDHNPTRYYLIGVRVGSPADRLTDRMVNGLNGDKIQGLVDHAQVVAPTMPFAVAKLAHVFGFAHALLLHLQANLHRWTDKKSA